MDGKRPDSDFAGGSNLPDVSGLRKAMNDADQKILANKLDSIMVVLQEVRDEVKKLFAAQQDFALWRVRVDERLVKGSETFESFRADLHNRMNKPACDALHRDVERRLTSKAETRNVEELEGRMDEVEEEMESKVDMKIVKAYAIGAFIGGAVAGSAFGPILKALGTLF